MKITVRRKERCQVAEMMEPPKRLTNTDYIKRNKTTIKKRVPPTLEVPKPFKMRQFADIPSKVYGTKAASPSKAALTTNHPNETFTEPPTSEQIQTVQALLRSKEQILYTLRRLPSSVSSPSIDALRIESEFELGQIEIALKAFSTS